MRHATKFILLLLAAYVVLQLPPVRSAIERTWTSSQIRVAVSMLESLYARAGEPPRLAVYESSIVYPTRHVRVAEGCNAVLILLLVASAIAVSHVHSLQRRLLFVVLAVVWIYPLNILRIAHLAHLSTFDPELFETAHIQLWQIAFILTGVAYLYFVLYFPTRDTAIHR